MKDILKTALRVQTEVLRYLTQEFTSRGFYWMLPVMLSPITDPLWPEPEAPRMRAPEIEVYGKKMRLMHSMILHKQVAIAMGLRRIFILSPNVRIEPPERKETGRHLFEFTQLDFEVEGARAEDIMKFVEGIFEGLLDHLAERSVAAIEIDPPFPRVSEEELKEELGKDWEAKVYQEIEGPFWVTDIPREFYDREDPERPGHYLNYDLYLPEGFGEVLSGGEREYEYERIVERMKRDGLSLEEFKPYLNLAEEGKLRPSAGAGIGIERLVRFFVRATHIKEVQPFPRVPGVPPEF